MWEMLLEVFAPLLLEVVSGAIKPRGNVKALLAEAKAHYDAERYADAEQIYRRLLAIRQARFGEKHKVTAYDHNNLGIALLKQEKFEEACEHLQTSLKVYKELEGPHSCNVAIALANLGLLFYNQSEYSEAENYVSRSLVVYHQASDQESVNSLNAQKLLAWSQYHLEQYDLALSGAESAREGFERLEQRQGIHYLDSLDLICSLHQKRKTLSEIVPVLRRVKAIREQQKSTSNSMYTCWLYVLAAVMMRQKEFQEAESLLQTSIALRRELNRADDEGFKDNLCMLASLRINLERFSEAEPLLQEALLLARRLSRPDSPRFPLFLLARLCYRQGRDAEVVPLCEEYLELHARTQQNPGVPLLSCRIMLGRMYGRQAKYWQAHAQLTEAQSLCHAKWGEESAHYAAVLAYLGEWNHFQGRDAEALPLVTRALEIFPCVTGANELARKTAQQIAAEILERRGHGHPHAPA